MRSKSPALVISFTNVTEALAVEQFCQEQGLPGRIIPVPREITAGCGLAWKAAPEQRERLLEAFSRNGLLYSGDYIVNI